MERAMGMCMDYIFGGRDMDVYMLPLNGVEMGWQDGTQPTPQTEIRKFSSACRLPWLQQEESRP